MAPHSNAVGSHFVNDGPIRQGEATREKGAAHRAPFHAASVQREPPLEKINSQNVPFSERLLSALRRFH